MLFVASKALGVPSVPYLVLCWLMPTLPKARVRVFIAAAFELLYGII